MKARIINDGIDALRGRRLNNGDKTRVYRSVEGQAVSMVPGEQEPPHAWKTTVRYNGVLRRFEAFVMPGLVNGVDPIVPVKSLVTNDYMFPFSDLGRRGGSVGESLRAAELSLEEEMSNAGIAQGVWIPMFDFRVVDGTQEPVQPFFTRMGVRTENPPDTSVNTDGGITLIDRWRPENNAPERRLMACDVFLAKPRPTYRGVVEIVDITGATGTIADYSVTYDTTTYDKTKGRAKIYTGTYVPNRVPTIVERLMGQFQDEGEDRRPLATVFFVSPYGASEATAPDHKWTPYVQHHCFWNLTHKTLNKPPLNAFMRFRLNFGLLAFGFAGAIGNALIAPSQDLLDQISNAIFNTTPEGKFWTK